MNFINFESVSWNAVRELTHFSTVLEPRGSGGCRWRGRSVPPGTIEILGIDLNKNPVAGVAACLIQFSH